MSTSVKYVQKSQDRYWWHRINKYEPSIYRSLSADEWSVLDEWFSKTDTGGAGEVAIPFISTYIGFISGNGLSPIIECGGYRGYSALLTGFEMRHMNKPKSFVSIELQKTHCDIIKHWIDKADLGDYVEIIEGSSIDPDTIKRTLDFLVDPPHAILLDTVHTYNFKLEELETWYPHLIQNGFIFAHDTSEKCQVQRDDRLELSKKWRLDHPTCECININRPVDIHKPWTYKDGQGLMIIQKL